MDFIKAYLVGVGIGMLILIPTAAFMLESSSRSAAFVVQQSTFTMQEFVNNISLYTYVSGISIVALVAIIGTLVFNRKLQNYVLLIPLLIMNLFTFINYFLNIFQYVHVKQYIMILPIYWLLFARVSRDVSHRVFTGLAVVASIVVICDGSLVHTPRTCGLFIISIILIVIIINYQKSMVAYPAMIILAIMMAINGSNFTTVEQIQAKSLIEVSNDYEPYRVTNGRNQTYSTSELTPTVYSSLENGKYLDVTTSEYESTASGSMRITDPDTFKNAYFQNMFGISNDSFTVNPIAYGVPDSEVYPLSEYKQQDASERLYAANQAIFVDEDNNKPFQSNFNFEEIYSSDKEFTIPKAYNAKYTIPSQYQNGIMTITFNTNVDKNSNDNQLININNLRNQTMYRDGYGINDNTTVTFIINTYENPELNIQTLAPTGNLSYSDLRVTYQDLNNFTDNKMSVSNPESFEVDANNSMEFNLNLDEDGYLATTIPYGKGYTMTVDGKETDIQLINDLYIGAKLPKGVHHIKIEFHIPGFSIGLAITLLSVIVALSTAFIERKNKK